MHIHSTAVPLIRDNIDTDQIIPAKFLSITDKKGLGANLFYARRYLEGTQTPNPDFVCNQDTYTGSILLTGDNFGCGSSREHAAWALADYGFKAVIARGFSDIFYNNALNNNLLAVAIDPASHQTLVDMVTSNPSTQIVIDLPTQTVSAGSLSTSFTINAFKKHCLLTGEGNLEYILANSEIITHYEQTYNK